MEEVEEGATVESDQAMEAEEVSRDLQEHILLVEEEAPRIVDSFAKPQIMNIPVVMTLPHEVKFVLIS